MRRLSRWAMCLALVAGVAFAAVPGAHRVLAAGLYGMAEPAANLRIDDPARAAEVQRLIAGAEDAARGFFGTLRADPLFVVCTTTVCQDDFALRPRGLSLGYHFILIAPDGIDPMIFTHERIHAELHRFMGPRDLIRQRFPAWFDEGLASHLAGDTRLNRPADPRDADWIRAAHSFRDWGRVIRRHGWKDSYGAAARLVAEIEAGLGRDGLLTLIHRVGDGADFEELYGGIVARQGVMYPARTETHPVEQIQATAP